MNVVGDKIYELAGEYRSLDKRGLKKIQVSKSLHALIFSNNKLSWRRRFEYYISDEKVETYCFHSYWYVFVKTLFFPVNVVFDGLPKKGLRFLFFKGFYMPKKFGNYHVNIIPKSEVRYAWFKKYST